MSKHDDGNCIGKIIKKFPSVILRDGIANREERTIGLAAKLSRNRIIARQQDHLFRYKGEI
ncbi:MAG TPA: hypothetical protein DIT28_11035 [Oxalobacteraceae bacterium]|nr:hypothetical protein [Oxalobacteraceae bacterium]HCN89694.1 hypothetical protein [Oxalobacteraceae bacterium]